MHLYYYLSSPFPRVGFEASADFQSEEDVVVMDEDEWTDRNNFGATSLEGAQGKARSGDDDDDDEDTDDDSVSDLDTDSDDEEEDATR